VDWGVRDGVEEEMSDMTLGVQLVDRGREIEAGQALILTVQPLFAWMTKPPVHVHVAQPHL